MKEIGIGLIGYKFMGKAHSHAYRDAGLFFDLPAVPVMKVLCGRSEQPLKAAAEKLGWQEHETDWRNVVGRKDIDIVDISTPQNIHRDIAVEAAKEGKTVLCEKPLASTLKDAYEMVEAAEKHGVKHAVCFNYRKLPAVGLAKNLIKDGKLGKIYHMRAVYLQDWIIDPEFPLVWRLQKSVAGSGAHGDLNAHIIDMARYLVGEFEEVAGVCETFIKKRPLVKETGLLETGIEDKKKSAETGDVTVDDAALFLARFKNGALGSFEATRFAAGRKNGLKFEINGSKGSIVFNLENLNELDVYSTEDPEYARGFKTVIATDPSHPYAANWWPAGHIIGYGESFINLVSDLLTAVSKGEYPSPDFYDGLKCQEVLSAVEESAESGKWVKVKE
ncbi:MAG: Gfo/Idh/MocA family oxidoreductase [Candidatus Omnitrophica bacterium]|nr:Gfo/Idh/MocA family oxidoreductase [Candidatus Omnitrophota bacterium]